MGHSHTQSVQIDGKITQLGVQTDVLFIYPIWSDSGMGRLRIAVGADDILDHFDSRR